MRYRAGQTNTAAIIVASIFALMFIGTVTFFVVQFQKGSSAKKTNKNTTKVVKNNNKNTNTETNTNTPVALDLTPLTEIPETWKYYTNQTISYSLRYPATWTLQEVSIPDHPVQKIPVKYIQISNPGGQVVLSLGVRRVGDVYGVSERTTAPVGTTQPGVSITIGKTAITTSNLVVDSKVTAIFFHPLKPFGYTYLEGREIQAEVDLVTTPGVASPITDLVATADTQIANTIMTTLSFSEISNPVVAPPPSASPLGQYRIETFRETPKSLPDTRLVNLDGGRRTVVIESTRSRAGLAAGHGLMSIALPAFGTILYFQDQELKTGAGGGAIWTYDTTAKRLVKQVTYQPIGWGKIVLNKVRTRAVYTSSTNLDDSGAVQTLYYIDLIKNTVATLVTLRDNQTFSAGWGGTTNVFSISFVTDDTVRYTFYDQNSGNKQTKLLKTKLGEGQAVVPGANPATQ